jgi:hypothetical protein
MTKNIMSKLTVVCIGDIMIFDQALASLSREGQRSIADRICDPLVGSDLVVANMETPITSLKTPVDNKFYNLQSSPEIIELFDHRFVFSLANNHILDYGEAGLRDTIENLKSRNIRYGGAGLNLDEAGEPVLIHIKGRKVGIICAADTRFQAATSNSPGVFPAHYGILKECIRDVKKKVDIVIVTIHAGMEFLSIPSPNQIKLAQLCIEENVHVLSFHHAHCISGIKRNEQSVVFFGTGKYVFPNVLPGKNKKLRKIASWRFKESAAWHVSFDLDTKRIESLNPRPIMLGDDGFPSVAHGSISIRILRRILKYSRCLDQKRLILLWYLQEMIKFDYLWLNTMPIIEIARRKGVLAMLCSMVKGVKSHMKSGIEN